MTCIHIIIGSVTGTALEVGKTAHAICAGFGDDVILHENFEAARFDPKQAMLICTSNTGMGDLPANIVPFYTFLTSQYPQMYQTPYGLINLGDSSYPDFAKAGYTLDAALSDLGAQRLGDVLVMDACDIDDHQAAASQWITHWRQQLERL